MKLVDISETTNDGVNGSFEVTLEIRGRLHTYQADYSLALRTGRVIGITDLPNDICNEVVGSMREAVMAERDARAEAATKAARQKPGHATAAPKIFVDAAFAPTVKYLN